MVALFAAAIGNVPAFAGSGGADGVSRKIVFVSDTQAPFWFEKIYLRSDHNRRATKQILGSILRENDLAAVIHAGDITEEGSSKKKWEAFRPFLDSLHDRGIPFIAARGNHEYMMSATEGMRNFASFVPSSVADYSLHIQGSVALLILNSNFSRLPDSVVTAEAAWYASMLDSLDADSAISFIVTVSHHPPFTNSTVVSPSRDLQKRFLPAFYHSAKSALFVSGHAHRFEHFRKEGKDFLVIGGGGGSFHPKKSNPDEADLYDGGGGGRFFHYVRCLAACDSLSLEVVKVNPGSDATEIAYRLTRKR
jgi:hypothetical protein